MIHTYWTYLLNPKSKWESKKLNWGSKLQGGGGGYTKKTCCMGSNIFQNNRFIFKRPQHESLRNKPHKLLSYSPEPHTEVYCFRLNFNFLKLVYSSVMYLSVIDFPDNALIYLMFDSINIAQSRQFCKKRNVISWCFLSNEKTVWLPMEGSPWQVRGM